jgi:hypothetical protein
MALRQHLLQSPIDLSDASNNSNEITDEEFGSDDIKQLNSSGSSGASRSGKIASVLGNIGPTPGLADIISPSCIEMLSKEMLIDETYEFGACENCVESDTEPNQMISDNAKNNTIREKDRYERRRLHLSKKIDDSNDDDSYDRRSRDEKFRLSSLVREQYELEHDDDEVNETDYDDDDDDDDDNIDESEEEDVNDDDDDIDDDGDEDNDLESNSYEDKEENDLNELEKSEYLTFFSSFLVLMVYNCFI